MPVYTEIYVRCYVIRELYCIKRNYC